MGRQRTLYKLVGRYMRGKDTEYYGLISENNKEIKATEEQMAFYVGRDQVINVNAQLYKDKVLFRGINCDIRNLPVIQLAETQIKQPQPAPKPQPAPERKTNLVELVNERIDKLLATSHKLIDNFSIKKSISKESYLYINFTEDRSYCGKDSCTDTCIVQAKDNILYLIRNTDNSIIYKDKNIDRFMKILLSFLNIVDSKNYNTINYVEAFEDNIVSAFEDYSGASTYINDPIRGMDTKYCDAEIASYSMVHAVLMTLTYGLLSKINEKYKGILFRGERPTDEFRATRVEKGFISTTTSIEVAREFAGTEGRILAFTDLNIRDLIIMGNIAVCHSNGEPSEYEILLRSGMTISVGNKIGEYKGIPIYVAKATFEKTIYDEVDRIVKAFVNAYKNDNVYGTACILSNLKLLRNFEPEDGLTIGKLNVYTKSGNDFSTQLDGDDFIINGEVISRQNIKKELAKYIK